MLGKLPSSESMSRLFKSYYSLKPLLPRRLQLMLRRAHARNKLRTQGAIWPIDQKAAIPPKNWKGWPGGKQFAFLITHDVDTAKGQENTRHMIELERELGFRGSYNFVPERYTVCEKLREYITENGFEVGVHGLNHDGKYFNSRKIFLERSRKINQYIKEWNSHGFRTPSMHHKLDWLHSLDIKYDSSTFDTDPFEPQPDGVGTIFPFWVSSSDGYGGYIEMPYTLPQDFTLFVLLRQRNIEIWKRKLDWIAEKGGMALMLTHPDYINPYKKSIGDEEYPIRYISEFLSYVKKNYQGKYYHVLPRDLAKFWKENYVNN